MSRGKWKKPTVKAKSIIAGYRMGLSMRECAGLYDCSIQNVQQILQRWCPGEIREAHTYERFAQGPGR